MKPLLEVLNNFNEVSERYESLQLKMVRDQTEILRELNLIYKDLAEHRIIEYERWTSYVYNSTAKSNAAKESEATLKVPELYKLRHIMTSCKMLIDTVRSTIGVYKNDV